MKRMKNKLMALGFISAVLLSTLFFTAPKALASGTSESVMYPDYYANSDYANPERYTPNADDLSRFVYSEEMESKESVVVEDYVYYMEDGEVVVEPISGASINYNGKVSYSYGGYTYTVGNFTVNGYQAYCLEHDNLTPGDGTSNDGGNPYNDPEIRGALYYGWGGQGQIDFTSKNQGIVITSLVLDELYTNQNNTGTISECPQYKELESKARAGMPSPNFTFSDTYLTTTVSGGTQTSQTTKMNGSSENKVNLKIPSEVTFYNKTTGKTQKGGTVTIKGGDSFYFTAPSTYEPDYVTGSLKGSIKPVNPIVVKMTNSSLQDLGYYVPTDPTPQAGFTVQFKNYQQKVTVNHIDQRTGDVIDTDSYMKNTGENYTYSPRTDLKKDGIPYTPVSTTPVSGTVGTSPITINFYYTAPVVKIGLDSVKIPTEPASEGLDVYVKLAFDDVYDGAMTDSVNPKFTLSLYEGSTKITSTEIYPASYNPSQEIVFYVPSSMLNVNEKNTYTVKIEGYDSKNVYCSAKEIVIDGYTASEETIVIDADTTMQELSYDGVAGTYEKYGQSQHTAYESFSIPNITQLGKEKSGFGFELPMTFYYGFEDSSGQFTNEIEPPKLTMNVPNQIVDSTYVEYETDGVTSEVPLEQVEDVGTQSGVPYSEEKQVEVEKVVAVTDFTESNDPNTNTNEQLEQNQQEQIVANVESTRIQIETYFKENNNTMPSEDEAKANYIHAGMVTYLDTNDYTATPEVTKLFNKICDKAVESAIEKGYIIPNTAIELLVYDLIFPSPQLSTSGVTEVSATLNWTRHLGYIDLLSIHMGDYDNEGVFKGAISGGGQTIPFMFEGVLSGSHNIGTLQPNTEYTVEAYYFYDYGWMPSLIRTITFKTPPSPLTGLQVMNVTSDSITVGWDEYSGEEEFNIYLNGELYGTAELDATSYEITDLEPNTSYTIVVEPVMPDASVASEKAEVSTTTLGEDDVQPITGLKVAEVTTDSITVVWDQYSGEDQFNVYLNGELYDTSGYGSTSYTLADLEPNTMYTLGIQAQLIDGTLSEIEQISATTEPEVVEVTPDLPQAPTNVTATSSANGIDFSWSDGSYADSYNVYLNGTKKTNTTSNSYSYTGLSPNTTYTVGVSSVNEYGESDKTYMTISTLTVPTQMQGSKDYRLPHVWCEEMSGELFSDEQVINNDPRITDTLIDGGNKFYTPIWCELGQYPITVTNKEPIGANEVNIEINYVLDVYAQMYGTMDSDTIEDDHIIWHPIDVNNPFPEGKPENWTDEDVEWLASNNFVW